MTYRLTKKAAAQRKRLISMRAGRERIRLAGLAEDYPVVLPDLRRRLVIEDFDYKHEIHVLEFFKTDRIDCFRVVVDGQEWKRRIGFSKALAGLRKSMPRVGAIWPNTKEPKTSLPLQKGFERSRQTSGMRSV